MSIQTWKRQWLENDTGIREWKKEKENKKKKILILSLKHRYAIMKI